MPSVEYSNAFSGAFGIFQGKASVAITVDAVLEGTGALAASISIFVTASVLVPDLSRVVKLSSSSDRGVYEDPILLTGGVFKDLEKTFTVTLTNL